MTGASDLPPEEQWWWCRTHEQVEQGPGCARKDRMGPYASRAEAEDWRATAQQRTAAWDDEDEEWRDAGWSS